MDEDAAVTYPPTATRESSSTSITPLTPHAPEEDDLPPVDSGRQAWMFVASAFALEMLIWGYSTAFGTWQVYYSTHEPFSSSSAGAISAIGTTSLSIQYMSPLFLIQAFVRYPEYTRVALWSAMVVNCGAMIGSSWCTKVWQLILTQGLLNGISGAVLYTPCLIYLNQWFHHRRGMASGIIFGGTGIGGFVFPFMIGALLDRIGFAWTVRFWGLFTLVTFTLSILTCKPRIPVVKENRARKRVALSMRDWWFLRNPLVLFTSANALIAGLSFFPVSVYISTYTTYLPSSPLTANIVLSILNAAQSLGQVGIGWATDRRGYGEILAVMGVVSGVTTFLLWGFADSLAKIFGYVMIFGFFCGANAAVWSAVARDVGGTNVQTSSLIFCFLTIWRGLASILGPQIASTLLRPQDSHLKPPWGRFGFREVIIFVGATSLASALAALGVVVVKRKKPSREEES